MSALLPKADIRYGDRNVRFGPKAEVAVIRSVELIARSSDRLRLPLPALAEQTRQQHRALLRSASWLVDTVHRKGNSENQGTFGLCNNLCIRYSNHFAGGFIGVRGRCPAVHFTVRRKMRWKRASLHDQMHEQMPSLLGVKD